MNPDIQQEIASLKRCVARAERSAQALLDLYGHGVRPSFVSADLAQYGDRVERYKAEIARMEKAI